MPIGADPINHMKKMDIEFKTLISALVSIMDVPAILPLIDLGIAVGLRSLLRCIRLDDFSKLREVSSRPTRAAIAVTVINTDA